jgi:hypothetical protein
MRRSDYYVIMMVLCFILSYLVKTEVLIELGVDYIEEVKPERWRAEVDGWYYHVNQCGLIAIGQDTKSENDNARYGAGNYFQTKEQAEAVAEKIKALLQEEQDKLSKEDK